MSSKQTLARVAGLLYLILVVAGGWAQLFVRPGVLVPGDAAATADNIAESATLFRAAFVADMVNVLCFLLVALTLYAVFRSVSNEIALAMVVLNAVGVAILGINGLNHLGALLAATDAASLGAASGDGLVLLFMELHSQGYLIAQIFYGLWLLPLGYLIVTSRYLPRALGILLMIGSVTYPASSVLTWTIPNSPEILHEALGWVAAAGEMWLLLWLLIKGVRVPNDTMQESVAA
jgi:hypothetical protein